jgi:hypothetical protein
MLDSRFKVAVCDLERGTASASVRGGVASRARPGQGGGMAERFVSERIRVMADVLPRCGADSAPHRLGGGQLEHEIPGKLGGIRRCRPTTI